MTVQGHSIVNGFLENCRKASRKREAFVCFTDCATMGAMEKAHGANARIELDSIAQDSRLTPVTCASDSGKIRLVAHAPVSLMNLQDTQLSDDFCSTSLCKCRIYAIFKPRRFWLTSERIVLCLARSTSTAFLKIKQLGVWESHGDFTTLAEDIGADGSLS